MLGCRWLWKLCLLPLWKLARKSRRQLFSNLQHQICAKTKSIYYTILYKVWHRGVKMNEKKNFCIYHLWLYIPDTFANTTLWATSTDEIRENSATLVVTNLTGCTTTVVALLVTKGFSFFLIYGHCIVKHNL